MEKIKGYSMLATTLINQFRNDPFGINNVKNAWVSMNLVLTGCVASLATGAALSIAEAASSSSTTPGASASRSMAAAGTNGSGNDTPGGNEGGGESGSAGAGNGAGASGGSGVAVAAVDGGGTMSREETVFVMNQIVSLFETVKSFQDSKIKSSNTGIESGGIIDSNSNTYLLLNELIYASIQLIQQASFALPMQRVIRLDRDRQVIELCCELYGSVEYLDRFIIENDFNIDEIELLPMGREVTYHVQGA
jgi:hypothetical protein